MFNRISIALVTLLVASPVFAAPRTIANKYTGRAAVTSTPTTRTTTTPQPAPTPAPQAAEVPAQPTFGTFSLSATQNGLAALAQFQLLDNTGAVVFTGLSGADIVVPAGVFTVRATLNGGNGVISTSSVTVNTDQRTQASADFATAKLSLSISSATGSSGIAKVYVGGVEVGSLGSSNQLTLPTGTYDVKVIHSGAERWFYGVTLSQNQLRNISAHF